MSWSSGLRITLVLVSLSLASTAAVESPPLTASEAIRTGRMLTAMFYDRELGTLVSHLTPELRQSLQGEDGLRAFRQRVAATAGRETERLNERVIHWLDGSLIYNRTARFSDTGTPVWVQWTLTPDDKASAFFVRPAPSAVPTIFDDYQTRARLRLPFRGPWFVYWGGRTPFENYHVESVTQRFAYDFVRVEHGRTYGSSPERNESYYCFGEPVLAPASGKVVKAIDGIPDNVPGQMNERQLLGNHVILDHGRGEHSFLAHLQQGSLNVKAGQVIERGDVLGRCGNSGRSSEPHLHYHLQTTADINQGAGLPAQFTSYAAGGLFVTRGEPARGQTIRPARRAYGPVTDRVWPGEPASMFFDRDGCARPGDQACAAMPLNRLGLMF